MFPSRLALGVVDFLSWLTAQTKERRVHWQRRTGLLTVTLADKIVVAFEVMFHPTAGEVWNAFCIYSPDGEELLRATLVSATYAKRPYADALQALFRTVSRPGNPGDRVIPCPPQNAA
jgi:hypothetical protein